MINSDESMRAQRPAFKTVFAVPLECESCIKEVSTSLNNVAGINSVNADLVKQMVEVQGTAAPSSILQAIKSTGRDAVLRGTGTPNSAAVCILETHAPQNYNTVKGLARIVQVAPKYTIFDLSLQGVPQGTYYASIHQNGDISRGISSVGGIWDTQESSKNHIPKGRLGQIEVGKSGTGSVLLDSPVEIWELIGRSMVVSRTYEAKQDKNDETTFIGIVARSAGVWENDKTVCSCSGKTVWQERKEQTDRGMI